ncbi:protein translocase subunit SecD [Methylotenera sp.]|uniref:protein translocase subunit SecD n=1 Tax=Methylotenera sp. TaxID=2051956 RepID=UPI002487AD68|nr:protein translocase subunit SecD [Methylotenera sp.]MDI1298088.1 protein translocase subunit SecD [Methylotenera sp.]
MNRYPMWKNILVAVMILIGLIYTIPNFFGESPAVQITPAKSTTKLDSALLGKVEDIFKQEKIEYDGVYQDARGVKARFKSTDTQIRAKDVLQANLGTDYTVALNLLSRSPNWLRSLGAKPMYLGLDLRGGVHFLMQVDMKAALSKAAERFVGDFKIALRKERISYVGVSREGETVQIRFNNPDELAKAHAVIAKEYPNLTLEESTIGEERILTASLNLVEQKSIQDFAIKQNIQTLHNRINELGVAEPIIQQQGADRVVVQLPGVQDTAKAKEILGRTATLEIRLVDEEKSDAATLEKAEKGQAPIGDDVFKNRDGRAVLVKKNVVLTGDYITDAGPGVDSQSGRSTVNVTLDARGARIFQQVTRENVGKRMAILLIEKGSTEVITAPTINEEIGGGRVQISGMANTQEATDIALLLRAGALAAPMDIVEERTVGPSMGQDNINRGVHSTLWGFAAIAVMMMIYYAAFGAVSVTALAINLLLLVAILSMLQATLTLPGLAAIALALGMAIDANVLINERIREELRNGNTPQASIHAGYERAWDTILDSNVTTLIAGLALFMFGTGPIKGFAVVHVLGILTSMFSAVLVSRAIVNLIYGYRRKLTKLSIGQIYKA